MKITVEQFDPNWSDKFETIKADLSAHIGFIHPAIEHIGSTSIEGLAAKPIIDILVGVATEKDLDKTIKPLVSKNYIYYECFNKEMPYRRFFVKHKINPNELSIPKIIKEKEDAPSDTNEHNHRLAHIHILPVNSEHWIRHITFRDYLRVFPEIRDKYQQLKEQLSEREWINGNDYNQAKDEFIKLEEEKATAWFKMN